jgi:hypothetical protein
MRYLFLLIIFMSIQTCGINKEYSRTCKEIYYDNYPLRLRLILRCEFLRVFGVDIQDRTDPQQP